MRKFFGLVFIGFGILFLLNHFNVPLFDVLRPLMIPVIIALLMLNVMISSRRIQFVPALVAAGAVMWILRELNIIVFESLFQLLWPTILIILGVRILFSRSPMIRMTSDKSVDVAFGGREQSFSEAKSTSITTMFGSNELDYRNATFPEAGVELDIVTMFGSTEIRVGDDVRVVANGTPLFGAFEDKTPQQGTKILKSNTLSCLVLLKFIDKKIRVWIIDPNSYCFMADF